MPRIKVSQFIPALVKAVNRLDVEVASLRRELAERGLAKKNARAKDLSPGLAERLYSSAPSARLESDKAAKPKRRRRSSESRAETTD